MSFLILKDFFYSWFSSIKTCIFSLFSNSIPTQVCSLFSPLWYHQCLVRDTGSLSPMTSATQMPIGTCTLTMPWAVIVDRLLEYGVQHVEKSGVNGKEDDHEKTFLCVRLEAFPQISFSKDQGQVALNPSQWPGNAHFDSKILIRFIDCLDNRFMNFPLVTNCRAGSMTPFAKSVSFEKQMSLPRFVYFGGCSAAKMKNISPWVSNFW